MPPIHELSEVDVGITLCKTGANGKRFFLMKSGEQPPDDPPAATVLVKADWSAVYCVVAEPGTLEQPGLVGDQAIPDRWASEEEIRKAAHRMMKTGKLTVGMHNALDEYGQIVENAVALADFSITGPDGQAHTIKKGSWYVAIEPNAVGRDRIEKGEFGGISIDGSGIRTLVEKAAAFDAAKHPRAGKGNPQGGQFVAAGSKGGAAAGAKAKLGGKLDEHAIREFQKKHGLVVDGKIGHQTTAALTGHKDAASVKTGALTTHDRTKLTQLKKSDAEVELDAWIDAREAGPGFGEATTLAALQKGMPVYLRRRKQVHRLKSEGHEVPAIAEKMGISHVEVHAHLKKDAALVPNKPGKSNWVEKLGGLPRKIADLAGDLISEKAMPTSRAIATAVAAAKRFAAQGKPAWVAAVARWEAMKAAAHAKGALKKSEYDDDGEDVVAAVLGTLEDVPDSSLMRMVKSLARRAGVPDEEIADAERIEKAQPTFAELMAQRELEDELPDAFDALRSCVWRAFYPDPAADQQRDPRDLISQSLDEFKDWALALLDQAGALQKEARDELLKAQLGDGLEVVADDVGTNEDMDLTPENKTELAELMKSAAAEAVKPVAERVEAIEAKVGDGDAEKAPTVEELKKTVDALVADDGPIAQVMNGMELLLSGDSSQPDDDAAPEKVQKAGAGAIGLFR